MQNNTTTRKWSEIQGLAAVTINTGKKIGTIDNFYFDPSTNVIKGFVIRTGFFGHRAILAKDINSIGTDALILKDEEMLTSERNEEELHHLRLGSSLLSYRLLSEGGNVIGTIGNIILDIAQPQAIQIMVIELSGGLREHISGHYPSFPASQITRYGQDVVVIPDTVAESLLQS